MKNPAYVLFLIMVVGLIFSAGTSALFWKLQNEVLEKELQTADIFVSHIVYSFRTPTLTKTMIFVSHLGGDYMMGLGVAAIILLFVRNHIREVVLLIFILVMGLLLNITLKHYSQRTRPIISPLVTETDYSFPSGHAMNSFVFYTTISYLMFHFTKNLPLTLVSFTISGILIGLIGLSRVYLGVHYPSDVLAGYIAGSCWFVTVILMQKTMIFFRLFHERKKI